MFKNAFALVWIALVALIGASCARESSRLAPKLKGMGDLHHPVTTSSPEAQAFFDQGLTLSYAFNHAEAARAFREAARLDPQCAMAHWGLALVLGPNINAPMTPDDNKEAYDAAQKALELAANASEAERAYIEALAARYAPEPPEDRKPLDLAYAKAMREVAKKYPDDMDAAALFAEALMDTTPWDYWNENGQPKESTEEILAALEAVIERAPDHAGANHLYIHAVEAVRPEAGIAAADRLGPLVPAAGHLVHMPAHIYIRVGRYDDAVRANERAIEADDDYITQCRRQGLYPTGYMPHNHHFLAAAATLEGRYERSMEAARNIAETSRHHLHENPDSGTMQHFLVTPYFTMARFGKWDKILREPEPKEGKYPVGAWRYARGMACARTGKPDEAARELQALEVIANDPELAKVAVFDVNNVGALLRIAVEVLAGEIAAARKDYPTAIARLEKSIELEDALLYSEPADWPHPVREILGAVLIEAGQPERAEQMFREDLKRYPGNGWSLTGLAQALDAKGSKEEAARTRKEFEGAWNRADVTLPGARY